MGPRRRLLVAVAALAVLGAGGVAASRLARPLGAQWGTRIEPNVPYDGRFTFVRIRYTVYRRSGWEFDYPAMERNFMKLTDEISTLHPHVDGSNVMTLDDPELMKYPIAYLSEPGGWIPNQAEVDGLRAYLAKGGFLWVDDFMLNEWENFERQMRRVLPDARFVPLDVTHPIYDAFFRLDSLAMHHPQNRRLKGEFFGIHEDNDPSKRLMVVIDYNTDVGDFMEWSGSESAFPVNVTNDAYKIAMNYIVYGLTR
jgi:hypothetical protein